ncbi:hypothetical protein ATANTOWER_012025 [Ataeniobius toweri]|uniref:Uncharacterized protein n=1 Tax=Ataeniobius toweri TaxID=208326 RepID=A0ABU7A743_9TELE|nr:hypothetical protein [Ataeniobius toweri]
MYSRAQQTASPSSPSKSAETLWFYSLPHMQFHPTPTSSHNRVPPSGAFVVFSVPETSTLSLLAVSEFSALLTFVTPGNTQTTVALWDMESGSINYHQTEGIAVPVQHSGERQHRLLLKRSGMFQVLFTVSQQDLLSRLMLFGSAATVDTVCHLNSWGHCSIPFHALQAGLKNRQLDTVDLYLKSKENVLDPSAPVGVSEQSVDSKQSLKASVQELFLALDLLCSAVRDLNCEAQSRQFSEQLLNLTLCFINTQIRSVLLWPHYEHSDVQSIVKILDKYVTKLRSHMKRFPWALGFITSNTSAAPLQEVKGDEWEQLSTGKVIYQSILTNQIPRAQAVLGKGSQPEQHLSALRMVGLHHVLSCLQCKDLQSAKKLLTNMWVAGKLVPISRARGRVHPGQVASPSQGNTQTTKHTLIQTPKGNLERPINLTGMSLDCGRKPEYPWSVTGGLPVRTPALSILVVVSLGKTLHLPCLLMVVRGPGGAHCMAASILVLGQHFYCIFRECYADVLDSVDKKLSSLDAHLALVEVLYREFQAPRKSLDFSQE